MIGRTFHAGGVLLETNVENIVSFVGWVPEKAKSDTKEDIAKALNSRLTDIDWVFSGDSFDEMPLETEEESEEDDSSESDIDRTRGNTAGASKPSNSSAAVNKKARR